MSAIGQWADSIEATYQVDPRIFLALVLVTIPPFYVAFAVAVRATLRARRTGTSAFSDRSFMIAALVVAATWLVPYVYVALYGRLPVWGWVVFGAVACIGVMRIATAWRRRTARGPEVSDE